MDKLTFVVVGQYHHMPQKASPMMTELIANLRELGEVNVFDMPHTQFGDSVEREENLFVHHYACPNGEIADVALRKEEMVRDIVLLGAKACFINYDVAAAYQPLIKAIHSAMTTYGIKTYTLHKPVPFRYVRNLWWDIRFQWNEWKLYHKLDEEIERAESLSGHHAAYGSIIYKQYEKDKAERKHLLEIRKKL